MTAMEDLFALQDEDVLRGQLEYRRARLPEADAVQRASDAGLKVSTEFEADADQQRREGEFHRVRRCVCQRR